MITVKQILAAPVGERFGGIELTIKTTKKMLQIGKRWLHSVVLTDNTGDILADVNMRQRNPLVRGESIRIIVAEIQALVPDNSKVSASGKKLYIDQYRVPTSTADEMLATEEEELALWEKERERTIRSKIKCLLVSSKVRTGATMPEIKGFANNPALADVIDEIVKG